MARNLRFFNDSSFLSLKTLAMKKWILSAVFILAVAGYAAAQPAPKKSAPKKEVTTTLKKGTTKNNPGRKTVLKQESSSTAKSDSVIKIKIPLPKFPDDSTLPPVKKNDQ